MGNDAVVKIGKGEVTAFDSVLKFSTVSFSCKCPVHPYRTNLFNTIRDVKKTVDDKCACREVVEIILIVNPVQVTLLS